MGAPSLAAYFNGLASVTGDNLNTFGQTCDDFAQLRDFIGVAGVQVFSRGQASPGDGYQGNFYWDRLSTASDDNISVIRPNGGPFAGRWIRITDSGFTQNVGTVTLVTGIQTVTFASALPTSSYVVFLSGNTPSESFGWSAKTEAGFNIASSNMSSTATVDWAVFLP